MKDKITGKFDSVKQLEDAYKKLEIEFTKRCQKVAQLEKELLEIKNKQLEKEQIITLLANEDFINDYILSSEIISNAVVSKYLSTLKSRNKINLLGSSGTVALYVDKKPTNLIEAKILADAIIKQS